MPAPERSMLLRYWHAFAHSFNATRFSVLVLFTMLALLMVAQGQDLLISIAEDERYVEFVFGLFVWAFSIWLWARVLLDIDYPEQPADRRAYNFWRRHLPRAHAVSYAPRCFGSRWRAALPSG